MSNLTRQSPGKPRFWTTATCAVVALLSVTLATGCSAILELEQCTSDDDCQEFEECNEEMLCQEVERESVTSFIDEDTTWTSDTTYVLENMIFVVESTLEIEAGTQIRAKPGAGLVTRPGAKLIAEGTRDEPIVFTSDQPVGERLAGDWAGLAMIGRAPTNREDFLFRVESEDRGKPTVGGEDESYDCGTLRYVRTEFGGSEVEVEIDGETQLEQALNGISLAGCGSETTIEYIQAHMSDDDGLAVFGGNVDIRNALVTRAQTDSFNFDTGWQGTAQYLVAQQDSGGNDAMEIQNLFEDHDAEPRANAQIYNFTLIGDPETSSQLGLKYQRGAHGLASHGIIYGHPTAGLYIESAASAQAVEDGNLVVQNTIFDNVGPGGDGYFDRIDDEYYDDEDERDAELYNFGAYPGYEGFYDYEIFEEASLNNRFGSFADFEGDPRDLSEPGWVPSSANTTDVGAPPEQEGFDTTGVFRGAFRPGETPWTDGWTAFPRS